MLALAICLAQSAGEAFAMWHTGTLRRTRSREWTFYAVNVPYWLLVAVGIAEHHFTATISSRLEFWAGTLMAMGGVMIRLVGHYQLQGGFSPFVELSSNHRLITKGLYSKVRHPMYAGSLLMFIGLPILLESRIAMLLAVVSSGALLIRIGKEEKFLNSHLPGYTDYAKQTWRLLPCVW